jgi:F0F1-type ATP synthase assembly protein I
MQLHTLLGVKAGVHIIALHMHLFTLLGVKAGVHIIALHMYILQDVT